MGLPSGSHIYSAFLFGWVSKIDRACWDRSRQQERSLYIPRQASTTGRSPPFSPLSFSTGTFQRRSLTCRIHDDLMTGTVECSGMDPNLAWSSRIGFPCVLSHRHGRIFPRIPNCRLLILLFDLYITFEPQSVVFPHTSRATQLKTSNVLGMVSRPGQDFSHGCCSSFAPLNHIFLTAYHVLNFRQQTLLLSYWNIQMFVSGIHQLSSHVVRNQPTSAWTRHKSFFLHT
jgi:hypothetical protein